MCVELMMVGMGCLIIATGIPVYLICVKWKSKPKSFTCGLGMFQTLLHCLFFNNNNNNNNNNNTGTFVECHSVVASEALVEQVS